MKKLLLPVLLVAIGFVMSMCGTDPYAASCVNEYSASQDTLDQRTIRDFITRKHMTGVKKTESGISYYIYREGTGQKPRSTSSIIADYRGSRVADTTGKAFDSAGYKPQFAMNNVIAGWTEGLQLIGEGGKIRLMIPSHLAYGSCGNGSIAPNTPLVFDIELVEVVKY
ncbi:FKBP-type peptidyl-prolyl cis-trans isomerase [Solitalea sp. MAHUQ-68]|uniref:Peptidyl-prolyl cis-trans isomerase n=1 Tax=Solitalea agri TaxID=2953739 RepID=A0A9X2F3Y2_9SPHI|nr:FKBP-type peptidyl-prolyl cis-trans isomerase [Solitalea agri]MCO4293841.1 FKBP-type peptidyl-prolyl cis-trans isomerase [Solitalea agri]